MRILSFRTSLFFALLLLTFTPSIFAQQHPVLQLEGVKMRTKLDLPKGLSTLTLCGLEPGNTYDVIATDAIYGQGAEFEVAPAAALENSQSSFVFHKADKNAIQFNAPTQCVDIQVRSNKPASMYLSVRCATCPESNAWLRKATGQAEQQSVLQVENGYTAEELVRDVLVGGGCFQVSNVTFSGQAAQIGTFSNGATNIGFSDGLIMATGNVIVAPGPNDSDGASQGYGIGTPDADLQTLTSGTTFDMADIEFDFVPTQNQVAFEFAFASEEYCEYVNTQFNDVFGFFISGPGITGTKNIALIPSTNTPVTINNVNHLMNSGFYTHNTPISGNDCNSIPPAFGPAIFELQYDGFTKKMTAVANVIPCQQYHIKLKIADVGDGVWDSAVFLRANSFNAGGGVLASPAYPGGFGSAYESCDVGHIRFTRGNGNTSQPLPIAFAVGGTATPGVDYVPISGPIVIPAGQMEVLVPINVIPDLIPEGPESIMVSIPNSCACSQSTIEFVINDRPVLMAEASDQFLCIGETASLSATVTGGLPGANQNYLWSTGETTASISPTTTGTYTVTVTDGCSIPAAVSVELVFSACGCAAETFVSTLGQIGQQVRGYGIYDSPDGNLYITGLKQDSAALIKMTPAGTVLWMRTFDVKPGVNDNISELITDNEGMLVGCGQSGDVQPGVTGFVFRYNPATNNMQWLNNFGIETPYVLGLVELPNGNYLIYDNPHSPSNDNRMLEITRADGDVEFTSPLSQKLNLGSADNFNSATIFNGKLYGVGRYTNGNDFSNMRNALSRINLATGAVEWTRLSHVASNQAARLYGIDLLIEDNNIISVSYGSEVDDNLDNSQIYLQKTGLGGNLIWVKRFNIPEAVSELADELISLPDGYLIYGRGSSAPSDLYLIKTDKNGVLQWSKKVDYGFNDYLGIASTVQSQILLKDNHLFFMASTEGPGNSQMLVAKTKLDGTVEGNCNFIQPVLVETSEVLNPANFSVTMQQVPFQEQTSTLVRIPKNTDLLLENQCKVFVNDTISYNLCPGQTVLINGAAIGQDTIISQEIPGNGGCDTLRIYFVELKPYQSRSESISLCPGSSVTIDGQVYTQSGTVIDTIPGNPGCDTIVTYTLTAAPYLTRSEDINFCPGGSVTIGGQVYTQSGTVIDTIPGNPGCDTIVTYTLTAVPYPTRSEDISFCPGGSVTIGGQVYTQSGTVVDTIPGALGCDTIVTYTLTALPYPTRSENISFCPGNSVTIGGQVYTQSGTVIDTIPGNPGCDTIVTYTLTLLPYQTNAQSALFCAGRSVLISGVVYTQPGIVVDTVSTATGCDIIVTYTLIQLPYQTRSESRSFCPGSSVTIDGQVYTQSGTVVDTIPGIVGCDTIVTYSLTLLPQPTLSKTIVFCPGETVSLGGNTYTQPATVVLTLPSTTGGCDTIATYILKFATPAPSNVSITCPSAVTIGLPSGSGGAVVDYNQATASSDCPCPGIALTMTSGLPSGSNFPIGVTPVCFTAKDSCGQSKSCCFNVTLEEDDPCDTKVVGCVKYELLTITQDMAKNRTYRIRVTNNCSNKLIYTAIQVPDGLVAMEPANFSTYTAPSGNTYKVRSPNFSPQYSVRYSSVSDSINNGESDVFKYTLPAQADVTFIHVVSRLAPYIYLGAHLNTFYCPIGMTPGNDRPGGERGEEAFFELDAPTELLVFPNPTSGELFADLSPWQGQQVNVQVMDSRGQLLQHRMLTAADDAQAIDLPAELPNGLYFLEVLTEGGEKYMGRFVVQR